MGVEEDLRRGIEDLRTFSGFQAEFEEKYERLRGLFSDLLRSQPTLSFPPALQAIETEFHQAALDARRRMKERIRQADRAALLHQHQADLLRRRNRNGQQPSDEADSMVQEINQSLLRMNRTMDEELNKSVHNFQIIRNDQFMMLNVIIY